MLAANRRIGLKKAPLLTVANFITLFRIILVPVIIWSLLTGATASAFALFLVAGLSDAVDGAVARTFNQQSELGTVLDPIADKVMLVSVFIMLAYLEQIPLWLAILVVSRDLLIVAGFIVAFLLGRPADVKPLWVSKANTAAQILLALYVLARLAFELDGMQLQTYLEWGTGVLTGLSAIAYMVQGMRHLAVEA